MESRQTEKTILLGRKILSKNFVSCNAFFLRDAKVVVVVVVLHDNFPNELCCGCNLLFNKYICIFSFHWVLERKALCI